MIGEFTLMALLAGAAPALSQLPPGSAALIAEEAERIGLARRPDTAKQLDQETKRIAVDHLLRDVASKAPPPTDAEVRDAYHAKGDQAKLQLVYRATREDAEGALDRLRKGASLAEEAKSSVDANTRLRGGDAGWAPRGSMPPALAADAFAQPVETWLGPYPLAGRWAVARAVERKIAPDPGDADALAAARAELVRERQEQARTAYVDGLRERSKVRLDERFLQAAAGRQPSASDRAHVVATIGKRKITYGDVLDAAGRMGPAHGAATGAGTMMHAAVAQQLVDKALLEDAAARAKVTANPDVKKAVAAARREVLAAAYYDDVAARTPAPTQADVEARYRERIAEFQAPEGRRCAHVLASTEPKAKEAQKRLAGGEPFDKVAREASEDPKTAAKGGDAGVISDEQLQRMDPAVASVIRQLPSGKVSEPVKGPMGWLLLRCERVAAQPRPLSEVQDRISAAIRFERMQAAVEGKLRELEQKAPAAKPDPQPPTRKADAGKPRK